jgi:hypothetical protein
VREQGVIEKCSLCLHRIQNARLKAKTIGKEFLVKNVTTACAEACPKGRFFLEIGLIQIHCFIKKRGGEGFILFLLLLLLSICGLLQGVR